MCHDPITLWVCPVSNMAGVARHIVDVASVGVPGWRLVVTAPEGPLLDRLRELGTPVIVLPVEEGTRAAVASLSHTIRALRPRIVHSHLARADFLATMASVGTGVRLVSTEHGIAEDDRVYHPDPVERRVKAALHRSRLARTDGLIAVSEATARAMQCKWHPKIPIRIIPNGVDRIGHASLSVPGLRVASISRLAPEKRVDKVLSAFRQVLDSHPDSTLSIAGDGPERIRLESLRSSLRLDEAVTFLGYVPATEVMGRADVLVQLSVWENCSYTLLDAINAGLGVVATPVGGNPELLPETCLANADDINAVATAIVDQALRPGDRPRLPRSIPTVPDMTERIASVYDEVLT